MAVYRFKVSFEDSDDVHRVIEIRSTQTFEDFHNTIQQAVKFDNSKAASFYMSDDNWRKGTEITLRENETDPDFNSKGKPKRLMKKSKIADFIEDPHQKMLYLFDFETRWDFTIELIKIIVDEDLNTVYPRCIKNVGTAPLQYKPSTVPPPVGEKEEDDAPQREKIFLHEERLDEGADEDLEAEEGGEKTEPGENGIPGFEIEDL
jgi:hypothetical protein